MKRLLTILMAMLMIISLAGCGSGSGENNNAQDSKKNYIGETEFLSPDEVTGTKSKSSETVMLTEENGNGYEYKVVFTYENFEDALKAHDQYSGAYINQKFPNNKDSKGYKIALSDPARNESNTLSIFIKQGIVITDELMKEMVGKYLCVEMGDNTDFLKQSWEDKSYYIYYEITEDEKAILYLCSGKNSKPVSQGENTLDQFLDDPSVKYEKGKITVTGSEVLVFEKTDEIPDINN